MMCFFLIEAVISFPDSIQPALNYNASLQFFQTDIEITKVISTIIPMVYSIDKE